eukprot:206460_1
MAWVLTDIGYSTLARASALDGIPGTKEGQTTKSDMGFAKIYAPADKLRTEISLKVTTFAHFLRPRTDNESTPAGTASPVARDMSADSRKIQGKNSSDGGRLFSLENLVRLTDGIRERRAEAKSNAEGPEEQSSFSEFLELSDSLLKKLVNLRDKHSSENSGNANGTSQEHMENDTGMVEEYSGIGTGPTEVRPAQNVNIPEKSISSGSGNMRCFVSSGVLNEVVVQALPQIDFTEGSQTDLVEFLNRIEPGTRAVFVTGAAASGACSARDVMRFVRTVHAHSASVGTSLPSTPIYVLQGEDLPSWLPHLEARVAGLTIVTSVDAMVEILAGLTENEQPPTVQPAAESEGDFECACSTDSGEPVERVTQLKGARGWVVDMRVSVRTPVRVIRERLAYRFSVELDNVRLLYGGREITECRGSIAEEKVLPGGNILFIFDEDSMFKLDPARSCAKLDISTDGLSAACNSGSSWQLAKGDMEFCSGLHSWDVRLDRCTAGFVSVGVCGYDANSSKWLGSDEHGFGYLGDRSIWTRGKKQRIYGELFRTGDTIGVNLDMNKRTLSFSKNDVSLGIAFESLPQTVYPAVALFSDGDRVSLGNFQKGRRAGGKRKPEPMTFQTFRQRPVKLDVSRRATVRAGFFAGDRCFDRKSSELITVVGIMPLSSATSPEAEHLFVHAPSRPGLVGMNVGSAADRLELRWAADPF